MKNFHYLLLVFVLVCGSALSQSLKAETRITVPAQAAKTAAPIVHDKGEVVESPVKAASGSSVSGPSVSLTCTPPTAGITAASFDFYRSTTSGGSYTLLGNSSTCSYLDTTVSYSTTYYYVATALDSSGDQSGYSNEAPTTVGSNPVPNAPTSLSVTALAAKSVSLAWVAPASGAIPNSYNVYRSTSSGSGYVIVGTSTTASYVDSTVAYGNTYYYVATAVNTSSSCPSGSTCESADSNQVTATLLVNPPTGLTVGKIISSVVPLNWKAPLLQAGLSVHSYSVWRGQNPAMPLPMKIATVAATAYADRQVPKGTYYYEVTANDREGKITLASLASNIVEAIVRR